MSKSVKSFLPFKSLSYTSFGISFTSSNTSSLKDGEKACLYIKASTSTPTSFLCPIMFVISQSIVSLSISFK